MSYESIESALSLGKNSDHVVVRQVVMGGEHALASRGDAGKHTLAVMTDAKIEPAARADTIKARTATTLAKLHETAAKLDKASQEIAKSRPAVPSAENLGEASIDTELRQHIKALPNDKRAVDQLDERAQLAVARAPAVLSGIAEAAHQRLQDAVLHRFHPALMEAYEADRLAVDAARRALIIGVQTNKTALKLHDAHWNEFVDAIGAPSFKSY